MTTKQIVISAELHAAVLTAAKLEGISVKDLAEASLRSALRSRKARLRAKLKEQDRSGEDALKAVLDGKS